MAALTAGMDSQEAVDWLASLRLDPLEEDRADVRHAQLSSLLVRLLTGKAVAPSLFLADLPWHESAPVPAPVPQSPLTLMSKIDAAMMAFGGRKPN